MSDAATGHTIPDIALHCLGGAELVPADLRGQKLVIFFCPSDPEAAAREIEEFRALGEEFAAAGAWLIGVLEGQTPPVEAKGNVRIALAEDSDGSAWAHFEPALHLDAQGDRASGATFYFERWGNLRHAWPSGGHAREALEAAKDRG